MLFRSMVTEDCYGKSNIAVPVEVVYNCIKHDNQKDSYRRFDAALGLLESLCDKNKWSDVQVVLYGH